MTKIHNLVQRIKEKFMKNLEHQHKKNVLKFIK